MSYNRLENEIKKISRIDQKQKIKTIGVFYLTSCFAPVHCVSVHCITYYCLLSSEPVTPEYYYTVQYCNTVEGNICSNSELDGNTLILNCSTYTHNDLLTG